jgi:hypothetical protein
MLPQPSPTSQPPFSETASSLKIQKIRPFVLHVTASCSWRWVWRIGVILVTGQYRSPRSKPNSSATLSTLNPRTTPGINKGLRSDKPPIKADNLSQSHFKIQFVNTPRFGHKNQPVNFILIEDIPFCFNSKSKKQNVLKLPSEQNGV